MTVFWLILAAALLVFGRLGTRRVNNSGLGEVLFGVSQLAMLGCLALAFFSLFDRPPPAAAPTITHHFWTTLGAFAGGAVAVVVVGMTLVSGLRHLRLGRDEVVTPELTLRLDHQDGAVHLHEPGTLVAHRIGMGRLLVDVAPYEVDGHARTRLVFRQWPASRALSPETAATGMAEVLRVDVYANTARDVVGWLRRHPGIELDAPAVRREWQQTVDAMVRHAREQCRTTRPALETWTAYDGPSLDYLAIGPEGQVFSGTGEHTLVEPVERPLVTDGKRRVQVAVGNRFPVFDLTDSQVGVLRMLRGKGLVEVLEGRF